MPIKCCGCLCGSTERLIRNFLQQAGYKDWLSIPIATGKEKSKSMLGTIPRYPEVEMLEHFLSNASKWAVIIGWNENGCRWSDIAHNAAVSKIDAQLIVDTFS